VNFFQNKELCAKNKIFHKLLGVCSAYVTMHKKGERFLEVSKQHGVLYGLPLSTGVTYRYTQIISHNTQHLI